MSAPERRAISARVCGEIRHLTVAWHGSKEGRKWHSEHGKRTWDERESFAVTCFWCGKGTSVFFKEANGRNFCSRNCQANERRASGVDDEDRTCRQCGSRFRVNRYAKNETCSKRCGAYLRSQRSRKGDGSV